MPLYFFSLELNHSIQVFKLSDHHQRLSLTGHCGQVAIHAIVLLRYTLYNMNSLI